MATTCSPDRERSCHVIDCIFLSEYAAVSGSGTHRTFLPALLAFERLIQLERHLDRALRLLVEIAEAQLVYLELRGDASNEAYWRGYASTTSPTMLPVRARVSHGIVARTIAEGLAIESNSALNDSRFSELASVKQNEIGAVLCVPIGRYQTVGALYLQSVRTPSRTDQVRLELLATHLVPIASCLLRGCSSSPPKLIDQVRELQQRRVLDALDRYDGNVARAARELGVGRAFVYAIARRSSGVYSPDPLTED